jgi:ligand-binding SRPBCC domain-containing protein
MVILELETRIAAPAMRVFLLSLSIDLHVESAGKTRERAVSGVTHGLIGLGQSVTWRGKHFGMMLTHTSLITRYEAPLFFEDVMTRGLFRSFEHLHYFEQHADVTSIRDRLIFQAPLGPLGLVAERLVLRDYFQRFLMERNGIIKQVAESQEWRRYLPSLK